MRVGIVCPYAWSIPGGVQAHIADFATELTKRGHDVSVLAPGGDDDEVPAYVVKAGKPVPVPYNGSVARILFGPLAAARVRRWLADGRFDIVHTHEPNSVSVGMLATMMSEVPVVGTFHSSMESRALLAVNGIIGPILEKITARIAVSEAARRSIVQHIGGDAFVIPNGLYVDAFAVPPRDEWRHAGGTVCFIGRLDEPRKGLPVLLRAWPVIQREIPDAHLLIAGRGEIREISRTVPDEIRDSVTFLGGISDEEKATMFASSDVYIAPHTGGESFGIVLAEAMAGGAPVVASDLPAFRAVLDEGRLGRLTPVGDAEALAAEAVSLLRDGAARENYRDLARTAVRRYDWSRVTGEVLAVYDMALAVGVPKGNRFRIPGRS